MRSSSTTPTTPGLDWSSSHVSQYATMHPWEDWAETFAHYLHIDAGLGTASSIGIDVGEPARSAGVAAWVTRDHISIGPIVQSWLGLTLALNAMARSIGQSDLYPVRALPDGGREARLRPPGRHRTRSRA